MPLNITPEISQKRHEINDMSTNTVDDKRKVTTMRLTEMKARGEKIAMLTAYDYSMAKLIDEAGMDVILVGDSASNVMAGNITTLPISCKKRLTIL